MMRIAFGDSHGECFTTESLAKRGFARAYLFYPVARKQVFGSSLKQISPALCARLSVVARGIDIFVTYC
jgi:hypothetical protein